MVCGASIKILVTGSFRSSSSAYLLLPWKGKLRRAVQRARRSRAVLTPGSRRCVSGTRQTLEGPFSAVSQQIFASEYMLELEALDEIYQMFIPLHLSDLNNSENFRHEFWRVLTNFQTASSKFAIFVTKFCWNFTECPENGSTYHHIPKI